MNIGVISEGHADRAVISNIILGLTGTEKCNIEAIRPIYNYDETDKSYKDPKTFSTWSVVKKECLSRELIDGFLAIEGQDFVVIHLDSAEAEEYGLTRPDRKSPIYGTTLRTMIIQEIETWLNTDISESILYAVAIEEIEAWLLPIYDPKDSIKSLNPKEKLGRVLIKKGVNSTSSYENFDKISKPLSKTKKIVDGKLLEYNSSLSDFYNEVKNKVLPKLENKQ